MVNVYMNMIHGFSFELNEVHARVINYQIFWGVDLDPLSDPREGGCLKYISEYG